MRVRAGLGPGQAHGLNMKDASQSVLESILNDSDPRDESLNGHSTPLKNGKILNGKKKSLTPTKIDKKSPVNGIVNNHLNGHHPETDQNDKNSSNDSIK